MKHLLFLISLIGFTLTTSLHCQAQTLENYFVTGLKSQLQINQETRSALINGYRDKKETTLKMKNGSTACILEYKENDYLKIKTSEQGYFALKRWNIDNQIIFGLSWWVCSAQCDGIMKMVKPNSLQQPKQMPQITLADFANADSLKKDGLTVDDFVKKFEIDFIHYEFSKSDTIWVINNTPEFLDQLRQRKYKKYWKGNALPFIQKNGDFIRGEITTKNLEIKKDQNGK